MADMMERLKVRGGPGVLVQETPHGIVLTGDPLWARGHSWMPSMVGADRVTVGPGLFDGVEPVMRDAESEEDWALSRLPPPALRLREDLVNAESRSWLVGEVKLGEGVGAGGAYGVVAARVVQVPKLGRDARGEAYGPDVAQYPLVLLRKRDWGWEPWPVAHFDVKHWYRPLADSQGTRHFFVAV